MCIRDSSNVTLLSGTTLDEYKLWSSFHPSIGNNDKDYILRRLSKMFQPDKLNELTSAYAEYLGADEMGNIYSAILTDICFGIPTHKNLMNKKTKSFGYLFSTQSEILQGKLGCFHASELPYIFGVHTKKPYSTWGPKDSEKVSENLQMPWTSFARSSNPSFGAVSYTHLTLPTNVAV